MAVYVTFNGTIRQTFHGSECKLKKYNGYEINEFDFDPRTKE